jgi:hypothetical protein
MSKPKAKKQATPKVVQLDPQLAEFRRQAKIYREADEKVKLFEAQRKQAQPVVKAFVDERGAIPAKKKSAEFIDEGIKWTLVPSRTTYDEDAGIEALIAAAKTAKGEAKAALATCLVTKRVIDRDAYNRFKAAGLIPASVIEAFETGVVKSLRWGFVDKLRCSGCDTVVSRDQKFCHECGVALHQEN